MNFKASNVKTKIILKEEIKKIKEIKYKAETINKLTKEVIEELRKLNTEKAELIGTNKYSKLELISKYEDIEKNLLKIKLQDIRTDKEDKLYQCDECNEIQSDYGFEIEEKMYCYECASKIFRKC